MIWGKGLLQLTATALVVLIIMLLFLLGKCTVSNAPKQRVVITLFLLPNSTCRRDVGHCEL